jgi:capsular exopolysaccharide synthesis family protein
VNRETLRPIWGYKWWLLLFVVVASLIAYVVSSRQANTYQSTASVQLQSGLQASGQFIDQNTLTQLANTYQTLAGTDAVASRAAQLLESSAPTRPGLPTTTTTQPALSPSTTIIPAPTTALQQRLKNDVSISQESEVTVLDFVATTDSPRTAQQYAQAYASAFVQYVTDYQNQQRQDALTRIALQVNQIENQLNQIPVSTIPNAPEDPRRTALTTELQSLQTQAATQQTQARDNAILVQPATLPTSPASPNPKRDAALSGLAALIIGVLLVYLRVVLTEHYGSAEEAGEDLDLPVLAELPRLGNRPDLRAEAFRNLRTSLMFALRDRPNIVVLITSSEASAGKTFVTLNLATSLALEDRHVLAVDADLRRPMLHTLTDLPAAPGFANVLQGRMDELPTTAVSVDGGASVDITPAGFAGRELAELLSRDKLDRVIADLRRRYDVVIFDSPPVGAVVDAAIIGGRGTDGVIFVVNARSSRQREARRAVQTLRALEVPLLGIVFNESSARRDRYAERYAGSRRRGRGQ